MTQRNRHIGLTALTGGDWLWPSLTQQNLDSSDFLCYISETCRWHNVDLWRRRPKSLKGENPIPDQSDLGQAVAVRAVCRSRPFRWVHLLCG